MNVRACIFLGAALYPHSSSLSNSKFRTSKDDVEQYLLDPERGLGIDEDHVLDLFDSKLSPSQQLVKISEALQRWAPDAQFSKDLIIYYVGHGCFVDDAYVLSIGGLRAGQEGATGLNPRLLANTLKQFRVKYRKFIFLDCCYAAEALKSFQSSPDTLDRKLLSAFDDGLPRGTSESPQWGTALFCASDSDTPARSPSALQRTMFTDSLLHVLESGDPRLHKDFSIYELAPRVWERLQQTHGQEAVRPTVHAPDQSSGDISRWAEIFPNFALAGRARNRSSRSADLRARNAQLESALGALQSRVDIDSGRWATEKIDLMEQLNAAREGTARRQQEIQTLRQEAQSLVKAAEESNELQEKLAAREAEVARFRERVEGLLSKQAEMEKLQKTAPEPAALKPLPLIGTYPPAQQRRIVTVLVAACMLSATVLGGIALSSARQNVLQVLATSQALMHSQRLAKSVSQALIGSPQAFSEVTESTEGLTKNVLSLKNGSDDLAPVPAGMQDTLESLVPLVYRAEKNAKIMIAQQKTLTQVGQALRQINRQSSDLLEIAETVNSLKLQGGASASELSAVGQLVMLTQRIGKSANEFLTIEGLSPEAVFLLGKDLNSFREIADGLLKGHAQLRLPGTKDPQTKERLEQLTTQYEQTRTQARAILDNLEGLVSAREAQAAIVGDSEPLRKGLEAVLEQLSAIDLNSLRMASAFFAIVLFLVAALAWPLRAQR